MTRPVKASGLARLPELPLAWSRSKLGFEATVKARLGWKGLKAEEYVDDGYVLLSTPNIKGREIDFHNVNFITRERYLESPEIMLREGDVLLTKDGFTLGTTNVVRTLPRAATLNGSIALIRPKRALHSVFLYYLLASDFFQYLVHLMKDGMDILHLFQADLRHFDVLLPPLEEQETIASFLDRKTAAIDALIAKKERLIELLHEKQQALITQAVTKGFDPNVPMKESGIEWLGPIPAHWILRRLKHLGQIRSGIAKGRDVAGKATSALPYLRVANVQNGWLNLEEVATIEVTQEEARRYALRAGDVLMNEGGDFDKLGRGYVWEGQIAECIHQNHVFAVRPWRGVNPYWVNLATQASYLRHFFILRSKQSTNLASISSTNLGEAPIPMPPEAEVEAILLRLREVSVRPWTA